MAAESTLGVFGPLAKAIVGDGGELVVILPQMAMLLVAGMFLDGISIFLILLPVLVPVAQAFNWDLVSFGSLVTLNVAISRFTPPIAVNLMVSCKIAGVPVESTVRWVTWFVAAMSLVLVLAILWPDPSLWLPRILDYR